MNNVSIFIEDKDLIEKERERDDINRMYLVCRSFTDLIGERFCPSFNHSDKENDLIHSVVDVSLETMCLDKIRLSCGDIKDESKLGDLSDDILVNFVNMVNMFIEIGTNMPSNVYEDIGRLILFIEDYRIFPLRYDEHILSHFTGKMTTPVDGTALIDTFRSLADDNKLITSRRDQRSLFLQIMGVIANQYMIEHKSLHDEDN